MRNRSEFSDRITRLIKATRSLRQCLFLGLVITFMPGCKLLTSMLWWQAPQQNQAPQLYTETPTAAQIVAAVNNQSARVEDVQGQGRLSANGMMSLSAELALRPQEARSRLRAEVSGLTGTEVDLGSNPELFWVWVKRAQPPGVYYARHEEFAVSGVSEMIPLQPKWLTEAFGILQLDPYKTYEGPFVREDDGVELRWLVHDHQDTIERRIVVHREYGHILKQEWLRGGHLLASAEASDFEYFPKHRVSLPKRLQVNVPEGKLNLILEMDSYRINRPYGDPTLLYQPPNPQGVPKINVARPLGPESPGPRSLAPSELAPIARTQPYDARLATTGSAQPRVRSSYWNGPQTDQFSAPASRVGAGQGGRDLNYTAEIGLRESLPQPKPERYPRAIGPNTVQQRGPFTTPLQSQPPLRGFEQWR